MKPASPGSRSERRRSGGWLMRIVRDPTALFGVLVLALLVAAALFAPIIAPLDPNKQDLAARLLPPFYAEGGSSEHLLGTDQLGRDVLSRIVHGARISLTIPLVSVTLAGVFGTAVGLLAGYRGGKTDAFIMRIVDTLFSFPGLLLALTILAVVGPSFWTLAIVLSLRIWMVFARMTRGLVLSAREAEYVEAAELVGASPVRIMLRHIAPNLTAPLLTLAVLESAHVILSEAALSFPRIGHPATADVVGTRRGDRSPVRLLRSLVDHLPRARHRGGRVGYQSSGGLAESGRRSTGERKAFRGGGRCPLGLVGMIPLRPPSGDSQP